VIDLFLYFVYFVAFVVFIFCGFCKALIYFLFRVFRERLIYFSDFLNRPFGGFFYLYRILVFFRSIIINT
jgi:threonine/homoserine/homoserine lactone efflux protein